MYHFLFGLFCRLQVGKSEVASKSAMLALRYSGAKEPWSGDVSGFGAFVKARLDQIQGEMLAKATAERNSKLKVVRAVGSEKTCWEHPLVTPLGRTRFVAMMT